MSLRELPRANAFQRPQHYSADAPSVAYSKWASMPLAVAVSDDHVIEVNDVIGEDWWSGGGFTSNRMSGALRSIGPNPVSVLINSPGGDMFEGLAIYNMLQAHPAKVTVQVMGLAASAASVIAMAGDEVIMSTGSMMMIHNAWGVAVGNRLEMQATADIFAKFDTAMAEIYAAHTGMKVKDVSTMMDGANPKDDGTWMTASEAVANKFADRVADLSASASITRAEPDQKVWARRRIESALISQGVPRSERRALIRDLNGMPGAADPYAKSSAGDDKHVSAALARLMATMKV